MTINSLNNMVKKISDLLSELDDVNDNKYEQYLCLLKYSELLTYQVSQMITDYEAQKLIFEPDMDITQIIKEFKEEHGVPYEYIENGTYYFEKIEDGYKFVLPPLLNNRSKIDKKYIICVFDELIKRNKDVITKLSNASIIIVSQYTKISNSKDNDNVDAHDIINYINKYLLSTDDNPQYLNVFYDSEVAYSNKTEVYVVPKIKYFQFINNKKKNKLWVTLKKKSR